MGGVTEAVAQEQTFGARRPRIGSGTLLEGTSFRRLWLARLFSQVAMNALIYTLVVVVVRKTDSTIHTGLLVLSLTVPQVAAGPVAGVVTDLLPKRLLASLGNLLRLVACLAYLAYGESVWAIYGVSLGFASASQLHATAENAAVPALVSPERLASANALFNLASVAGQVVGMVIVAPLFLKTLGASPVYFVGVILFGLAAVVTLGVAGMDSDRRGVQAAEPRHASFTAMRQAFVQAWRIMRADRVTYAAVLDLTLVSTALLASVIVIPRYMTDVLGTEPENAVFVFSPAALGLLAGLRLAPTLARLVGNAWVATAGFAMFAALLAALAFVEAVGQFAQGLNPLSRLPLGWLPTPPLDVLVVALLLAGPLGFAYSLVSVAARALLHERAPAEMRGRILSAQFTLAALTSLVPMMAAGLAAHAFGVRPVLLLLVAALVLGGVYARFQGRGQALGRTYGQAT